MKTSVIISTYNGEKYVIEELQSINNQSRKADEVLIFDDCSTDRTVSLIENFIYENQLSNWKLLINESNKGWKKNFIDGISKATGDIIFTADQDDIWMDNKLEVMSGVLEQNNQIQLLMSNYIAFYENGKEVVTPNAENAKIIKLDIYKDFFNVPYPGCTYAFKKVLANKVPLYWENDYPHDGLLLKLALYSDSAYAINTSFIRFRRHSDSTFTKESLHSKTFEKKYEWLDYAYRSLLTIRKFINLENVSDFDAKDKNICLNLKWVKCRQNYYSTGAFKYIFKLLTYVDVYPHKYKQWLGDIYLVEKNKLKSK